MTEEALKRVKERKDDLARALMGLEKSTLARIVSETIIEAVECMDLEGRKSWRKLGYLVMLLANVMKSAKDVPSDISRSAYSLALSILDLIEIEDDALKGLEIPGEGWGMA